MTDDSCAAMFLAPDYPGGPAEKHGCNLIGPHEVHECLCKATGTDILFVEETEQPWFDGPQKILWRPTT